MPTLRSFTAIYTDGAAPRDTFKVPKGCDAFLGEMAELVVPTTNDELFGPHVHALSKFKIKRGFLFGMTREVKGRAGSFFDETRLSLLEAVHGLDGIGFDVLRMWPFPLKRAEELIPEERLGEDLFSVGFRENGEHGFRAETFGLAKLGQSEISFEFKGRELLDEAALMCGHLADWLMDQGRRVENSQSMAFGFDRISFFSAKTTKSFRCWHPQLIQRILPENLFPGVGALEVLSHPPSASNETEHDLTVPLQRSLEQRLLLEELDLAGDSPHATHTAQVMGQVAALSDVVLWREENADSKDSGWRIAQVGKTSQRPEVMSLHQITQLMPSLIRFLALPTGSKVSWDSSARASVEVPKSRGDELTDLDD